MSESQLLRHEWVGFYLVVVSEVTAV